MKNIIIGLAVVLALGLGVWYFVPSQATPNPYGGSSAPLESTNPNAVDPIPTSTSTPQSPASVPNYSMTQVALHKDSSSCWSAINGNVYNLTTWIYRHPGGPARILSICGKDGSSAFTGQHAGEPKPEKMLASFKIGVIAK